MFISLIVLIHPFRESQQLLNPDDVLEGLSAYLEHLVDEFDTLNQGHFREGCLYIGDQGLETLLPIFRTDE